MSAEDMGDFKEFPTKESALDWLDIYLSLDERNNLIRALEQESKTGRWIWCVGSHKCSNCEEYTWFSHKELLRYCPNCGAKMESEEV